MASIATGMFRRNIIAIGENRYLKSEKEQRLMCMNGQYSILAS